MPTALTWCCRAEGKRVFQFCKKCCRRTAKAGRNCNSYCHGCGGCGPSPPAWTGVVCESALSFRPASSLRYNRFLFLKILITFIYWSNSYSHNTSFLGPLMDLHTFSCPTIDSLTHLVVCVAVIELGRLGYWFSKVLRISKASSGRAYSNSSERMGGRRCRQIHPSKCGWVA